MTALWASRHKTRFSSGLVSVAIIAVVTQACSTVCGPASGSKHSAQSQPKSAASATALAPGLLPGTPGSAPPPGPSASASPTVPHAPSSAPAVTPATSPSSKVRFMDWLRFEGGARNPLLKVACGQSDQPPCPTALSAIPEIPAGTRCSPAVSFVPADAWHLSPGDGSHLQEKVIAPPGSITLAWDIAIPDRPDAPARPNQAVSVDWVVTCTFPDGETIGWEHLEVWVPAVEIRSFSPNHGPSGGGTYVEVLGHGFTGASELKFGSASGTDLNVKSDTDMAVKSPKESKADISCCILEVTSKAGTASSSDRFWYDS